MKVKKQTDGRRAKQQRKRPAARKGTSKTQSESWVLHIKESLLLLLLFAVFLLFFFHFGVHQVDGRSMFPTFQHGDRIVVAKNQQPKRYDIITFEPTGKKSESYIKRVMGMPGDTIVVEGTSLFLFSQEAGSAPITATSDMPDGALKINITAEVAAELMNYTKIPEDCYFVEGDNREHSTDSRAFGLIHSNQIEGIVNWRYFPFNKLGSIR